MKETLEIEDVHLARIYQGRFRSDMLPQIERAIHDFLREDAVTRQMRQIADCSEIWIKPNLTNPRPPETGCITHPVVVRALVDYLLDYLKVSQPIKIVETITYHKGAGMPEILAKLPENERKAIEEKMRHKGPDQDMHDFGFDLLLELSGIGNLVRGYQSKGQRVQILNLSKEPVMTPDERREITRKVESLLGPGLMPKESIRRKLLEKLPRVLKEGGVGVISLTLPKTHDEPQAWMTGSMKNIALGLYPQYKAFMHKDLAKAMVYHYAFWKVGLKDRIFGIVSGPLGQDSEGPIFGRTVDFPYIVAGQDLLKLDSTVVALVSGKVDLASQLDTFKYGAGKVGNLPSMTELQRVIPYSLSYRPYPYKNLPCCEEA
ncbi:MAG: DUF362 domain-containing protein [Promethearchaeati archaeon SRVP18_Atabeyarchaeia-1]